jgi:hypothetical protein
MAPSGIGGRIVSGIGPAGGPKVPELGLALGGALTAGMALYHFYLPTAFHWADALGSIPILAWALTILNASFSFLLLSGGVITIIVGLNPALKDRVARMVILSMALYWTLNAGFQVLLPLPRAFAALRWGFLGFSVAVILLYLSALVPARRGAARPPASAPPIMPPGGLPGEREAPR